MFEEALTDYNPKPPDETGDDSDLTWLWIILGILFLLLLISIICLIFRRQFKDRKWYIQSGGGAKRMRSDAKSGTPSNVKSWIVSPRMSSRDNGPHYSSPRGTMVSPSTDFSTTTGTRRSAMTESTAEGNKAANSAASKRSRMTSL